MKSRISIEVDFDNNNLPVIQILHADSDDVRDKLLSHFTQQLGGSSWCSIRWQINANIDQKALGLPDRIFISPIPYAQIPKHISLMRDSIEPDKRVTYYVADNSDAFHEFLKKENIKFERAEMFTAIMYTSPFETDIFKLGRNFEKFYQEQVKK